MPSLFALIDSDVCGWVCGLVVLSPLLFLCWCAALYLVRWRNALPTDKCPRCRSVPSTLDVHNVCENCCCEFDKWGNILSDAPPPRLDELDLAPFNPRCDRSDCGEGSPEFKTGGEVRE